MTAKTTTRTTRKTVAQVSKVSIIEALQYRLESTDVQSSGSKVREVSNALKAISPAVENAVFEKLPQTDFVNLAQVIRASDKVGSLDYISTKTIEKMGKLFVYAATGLTVQDTYIRETLAALLKYNGQLNVNEGKRVLCRKLELSETAVIRPEIMGKRNYSIDTSSSQHSQVRMLLRLLGLANVNKGKRNDNAVLTEYGRATLESVFTL